MPQFNRATMSMKALGTLILERDISSAEINRKLESVVKELNEGNLSEENIDLFCKYVRRLIQLLESIKIYAEREEFIDENVLRQWETHLMENKISQFEVGSQNILQSIHDIFLRITPELNDQSRDEVRLMRGKNPMHTTLANVLLNDRNFYRRISTESVQVGLGSKKRRILRYAAQSALLKLGTQPSRENLEAFRNSMMQLLDHLNWHLSRLFNVEKEAEILESHLVREIDQYIEISERRGLDKLKNKLVALRKDVIAYFTRDFRDAKSMFKATRRFVKEASREKEESKLIIEELIDIKSDYFHQAYRILESSFDEGIIEEKAFIRSCLKTKLAGSSFPLINHMIIERAGNEVKAVLYGQYIVRSNAGLIGYVAGKSSNPFKLINHLRLAFRGDARRHGKADVWLYISEFEEEKGKVKDSREARIMLIAMKRYGAIPLDFDYYQYPLGVELTRNTKPVMLILFVMSPAGRINGLSRSDLMKVLIPLHEDVYDTEGTDPFFMMTINSIRNKPFIGIKPGIL